MPRATPRRSGSGRSRPPASARAARPASPWTRCLCAQPRRAARPGSVGWRWPSGAPGRGLRDPRRQGGRAAQKATPPSPAPERGRSPAAPTEAIASPTSAPAVADTVRPNAWPAPTGPADRPLASRSASWLLTPADHPAVAAMGIVCRSGRLPWMAFPRWPRVSRPALYAHVGWKHLGQENHPAHR
jgi:hypothetical protein